MSKLFSTMVLLFLLLGSEFIYGIGPVGCQIPEKPNLKSSILTKGINQYHFQAGQAVRLINDSNETLQINQLSLLPDVSFAGVWGEYGLFLDTYTRYPDLIDPKLLAPGQGTPGAGEVGVVHKKTNDSVFPSLSWGNSQKPTALSVPPGSCVVAGANIKSNSGTFQLDVSSEEMGIWSIRQPRVDHTFHCDGTTQSTPWSPIQNKTDKVFYISGATIYANIGLDGTKLDAACIYILDVNKKVRKKICSNSSSTNKDGVLTFSPEKIFPNEYVAAQANNKCTTNQNGWAWGYVAYIYASPNP
jgi:hypothetical protein